MTTYTAIAINRKNRTVLLDDGSVVAFSTMLDQLAEETDDASECAIIIVQLPCGGWASVYFSDFDDVSLN